MRDAVRRVPVEHRCRNRLSTGCGRHGSLAHPHNDYADCRRPTCAVEIARDCAVPTRLTNSSIATARSRLRSRCATAGWRAAPIAVGPNAAPAGRAARPTGRARVRRPSERPTRRRCRRPSSTGRAAAAVAGSARAILGFAPPRGSATGAARVGQMVRLTTRSPRRLRRRLDRLEQPAGLRARCRHAHALPRRGLRLHRARPGLGGARGAVRACGCTRARRPTASTPTGDGS